MANFTRAPDPPPPPVPGPWNAPATEQARRILEELPPARGGGSRADRLEEATAWLLLAAAERLGEIGEQLTRIHEAMQPAASIERHSSTDRPGQDHDARFCPGPPYCHLGPGPGGASRAATPPEATSPGRGGGPASSAAPTGYTGRRP